MTGEIEALRARERELEARLEIHPSGYDGIASRDETIRQQERVIEGLRAEFTGAMMADTEVMAASRERERALREVLGHVAAIAHSGGLLGLLEGNAMVAIRRLTLSAWDRSSTPDEMRQRVSAALAAKESGT